MMSSSPGSTLKSGPTNESTSSMDREFCDLEVVADLD